MWEHYPLCYRLKGVDRLLIWSSEESGEHPDRIFTQNDTSFLTFESIDICQRFAEQEGMKLKLESDTSLHDIDAARIWARSPTPGSEHCNNAFSVWNMLGDAYESLPALLVGLHLILERSHGVYERLFYGCNLPAVTPENAEYNPTWDGDDIYDLERVFGPGVDQFSAVLTLYNGA